jgi:spermidine synthase
VYTDDETFMQMHLGPTFQSKIDLETGEPAFDYAMTMMELADTVYPDMRGKRALVIGGAGHAMARALENRGAEVTEVEIDPVVVALSDEYFGEIEGEVVVTDGRVYANTAPTDEFDLILMDAFDSGTGIPPQLTTREFFAEVERILTPGGVIIANFVGTPEGRRSGAYRAFASTIRSVFDAAGAHLTEESTLERQNIIFAASPTDTARLDEQLRDIPADGRVLTDDRNPIEILFERARRGYYFRR